MKPIAGGPESTPRVGVRGRGLDVLAVQEDGRRTDLASDDSVLDRASEFSRTPAA